MTFGKWPALAIIGVSLSFTPALAESGNLTSTGQGSAKIDHHIPVRHLGLKKADKARTGEDASRFGRATANSAKARQPTEKRINHYVQREENSGFGRLIRSIRHPSSKRSEFED